MSLPEILELEQPDGKRPPENLLRARNALEDRWQAGHTDPESARHLAFLWWWAMVEPDFLTGLPETDEGSRFPEIYEYLTDPSRIDDESRFVFGWMSSVFPYACGSDADWLGRGKALLRELDEHDSIRTLRFEGADEYNNYFSQMLAKKIARTDR